MFFLNLSLPEFLAVLGSLSGVVVALLATHIQNLPPNFIRNVARLLPFVLFVIEIYIIAVFYFRRQRN